MNQVKSSSKKTEYAKECIEKYRSKLLITTRKNKLISFNHSEGSRSLQYIRIIDELPDFLYGKFLDDRTLTFKALPEEDQIPPDEGQNFRRRLEQARLIDEEYIKAIDVNEDEEGALDKIKVERDLHNKIRVELGLPIWKEQESLTNAEVAKKHGLNPSYEMPEPTPEDQEDAVQHVDKFIQALLKPEEMERKLSGLNSHVRSDIEEKGINTLYIAFGFLEWYDSKNSDKPYFSPLLLLQLEIKKKQSKEGYTYRVQATGEEPEINLSTSKRLKEDFGIELPEFTGEDAPESYMTKVANLIKKAGPIPKKEKWCVRRFITIGIFRFERLVMWHDLNEEKWPGDIDISTNKIVQSLFTGSKGDPGNYHAEDYDIDTPEVEKTVPLLITSADASQHSALVDVMKGNNLAIKGPPGTGKSQTITNIIANVLNKGKTVLFLAEKMAALNVVHKRLNNANLGPYCLELHSIKAKKTEVLESIKERFEKCSLKGEGEKIDSKLQEFKRHRDYIGKYINTLNSKFGRQDKSIYDYLWATQLHEYRISNLLSILDQIKIPFEQADLTKSELTEHTEELETILSLKKDMDKESDQGKHPWRFVKDFSPNPFHQRNLKQLISNWAEELKKIQSVLKDFSSYFNLSITPSASAIGIFLDNSKTLADWTIDDLDQTMIADLGSLKKAEALVAFVEDIHTYRSAQEEIHTLKDVSAAAIQIKDIEKQAGTAKELDADTMSAMDIGVEIKELEEKSELLEKNLEKLRDIGEYFSVSKDKNLGEIYTLVEVSDYIASVSRDYLLFRTRDIIDETNAKQLKTAADTQKRIRDLIQKQEILFNLSMMGEPHEILIHAATLNNAGIFAFLNSSYRKAKKFYVLASKSKQKFNASKASKTLREIAKSKEECQKIEQDTRLQVICGSFFNGYRTDFENLQKINEWASSVRKRYAAGDEFTRSVRQWLLTAEMEELDSVRNLAEDDKFIALKSKIADIKNDTSPDTSVKKYLDSLVNKAEKLNCIKNTLQDIAASEAVTFADITEDLPRLQKARKAKIAAEKDQTVKSLFGDNYAGADTDIRDIERTARFIKNCLAVSEIKASLEMFLNKDFSKNWRDFIEKRAAVKKQHETVIDQAKKTQSYIDLSTIFDCGSWESVPYSDLIDLFINALDKPNDLNSWIGLNTHLLKATQDIKGELLAVYDKEKLDFETLPEAFKYMIYSTITSEIYTRYPVISSTKGLELGQARTRIKELDQEIIELQQDELCNTLNKASPLPGNSSGERRSWTEGALLHNEISKQKRHIPIRKLMERAPQSIQKIKPCFLMSPLAVAQYLEPGKFTFDLVVIDEASQMHPEDALGAIARAKQIVVVGDPKQLPPTSIFTKKDEDEEFEAIMDMALSSFRPSRTLSRHYRSQHESLIAFSNHHFYNNSLVIFPSPENSEKLGIKLKEVEGTYTSSTNMKEMEAVVKAALDFMREHPDRSLGIVAMNEKQKKLIEDEMNHELTKNPHASEYEAKWQDGLEPFFVKNLESVQGDERDAIFISTVYGPDKNGTVMQRFGPITGKFGHRRLNVLFTRAKKNMVVFTSLKPNDIETSGKSQGVIALKKFLTYASKGVIDEGKETHREPDSDFEICVKEKLESIGCEVHPQVGRAGYFIDLGVIHPKYPYGYLIGIECDGASYHSSKSARERDGCRQRVLEKLGWHFHRIWSTDWFSNPVQGFEKLKNYIEKVLKDEAFQTPEPDNVVIEHDFTPDDNEEEDPKDSLEAVDKQNDIDSKNVVQLFDNVTYSMIKDSERKEERSVQIVPTQGDPNAGTIAQHSAIGRSLLGCYVGDKIECILPIGEVILEILYVEKYK